MSGAATERVEFAPAKINLTLRIGRKRPDGYHDLESLVVFADLGDTLRLVPGPTLGLGVDGPTAAHAGPAQSNLVLKAARALKEAGVSDLRAGHFHLTKAVPVAAGLGGGSSDAAAALRLLARLNRLPAQDPRLSAAARATGADVPVCLDPRPRIMRGTGDILSAPLNLPHLDAVLVNPGIAVPTAAVFAALAAARGTTSAMSIDDDSAARLAETRNDVSPHALIEALAASANDLEAPALALFPPVGEALSALRASGSCRLARMSGSGGTCLGLYEDDSSAGAAANMLQRLHAGWWVKRVVLGTVPVPAEQTAQ